ncbi:TPM domain-containing protein [Selenomonadales bacterium OttesenSCG-928-I06]|nr:TPM domain-containing protein [Selenomonadales bacterium OttesenSCG-928-I06]
MQKVLKRLLSFVISLVLISSLFLGQTVTAEINIPPKPAQSIYVQDYANVLSADTKSTINTIGSELDKKTKAQIVVVTIDSLNNNPLEDYSLAVLRGWGIGDSKLNNGVLLLVAVQDRKSRIEVGYGLEGALNDAKTGTIQDNYLIPFFQQGNYDEGILNTYKILATGVAQEYKIAIDVGNIKTVSQATDTSEELPWWAQILVGIFFVGLLIVDWMFFGGFFTRMLLIIFSRGRGGGGFGGGSGGGGGSSRGW